MKLSSSITPLDISNFCWKTTSFPCVVCALRYDVYKIIYFLNIKFTYKHIHISFGTKTLLFVQILACRNLISVLPVEMLSDK